MLNLLKILNTRNFEITMNYLILKSSNVNGIHRIMGARISMAGVFMDQYDLEGVDR